MKKSVFVYMLTMILASKIFSQGYVSTQLHEGKITCVESFETSTNFDNNFYSAGNDGFLVKWSSDGMGEHYQVSALNIQKIARNPVTGDVAVYETDGISTHRVSVIDSKTYAKRFSKRFNDSIASLSFSAVSVQTAAVSLLPVVLGLQSFVQFSTAPAVISKPVAILYQPRYSASVSALLSVPVSDCDQLLLHQLPQPD